MPIMGSMVSRLSTVRIYSLACPLVFLAGLGQEGTVVGCFLLRALFVLVYLTGQGLGLCGCFAFVVFSQAFLTVLLCHFPGNVGPDRFSDGAGVFDGVVEGGDFA